MPNKRKLSEINVYSWPSSACKPLYIVSSKVDILPSSPYPQVLIAKHSPHNTPYKPPVQVFTEHHHGSHHTHSQAVSQVKNILTQVKLLKTMLRAILTSYYLNPIVSGGGRLACHFFCSRSRSKTVQDKDMKLLDFS